MMQHTNKYLRNLNPYRTASHKIWSVPPDERAGMLKLDWNEATISPSPAVIKAISALLERPNFFNLYPSTYNAGLIEALSHYAGVPESNIQYFAGSDSLHEYIAETYIAPGDPVLLLWPSYDNFRLTAEANGATVYYSEMDEDFAFRPDALIHDIETHNPSLVYICNPNNPTGSYAEPETLAKIITAYPESMFVIDEAYREFSGGSVNQLALEHDNILVTHTMSKAFALANFRFGYLVSCAENISAISAARNSKGVTTFAQVATIAALSDAEYMRGYVREVCKARKIFTENVNAEFSGRLHAYSSRGNFVLVRCFPDSLKDTIMAGLEERNIFVRNVSQSKSLHGCFRVTIGTCGQMERVIESLREILA